MDGIETIEKAETSRHSYDRFPKNYLKHMKNIRSEHWYDVFPFSLALWPQNYSETERMGSWWRDRCNYPLLTLELILDGELVYEQEGIVHHLHQGDLYFSHPGNTIRIKNAPCKYVHQLQLCIAGSPLKLLLETLDLKKTYLMKFRDFTALEERYREFAELLGKKEPGSEALTSAKTYELIAWLAESKRELSLADLPPPLTHSIRNMQAELSHNFSIPELAAMSNTSKATLNRLFRKYLNTSPQAYLNSLRMENAKNLIRRGNLSFKEIAEQLGFRNSLYFSTSFKKYTGVAPSEFRKECGTSE